MDFLEGDEVLRLAARDASGTTISTPTAKTVISYDYYIRKRMYEMIMAGKGWLEAQDTACNGMVLRNRYFLTPVLASSMASMSGSSGGAGGATKHDDDDNAGGKPGKGNRNQRRAAAKAKAAAKKAEAAKAKAAAEKAKAAGKVKGKKHTHFEGKEICFKFNNGQCSNASCERKHVCQFCLGPHPKKDCTEKQ